MPGQVWNGQDYTNYIMNRGYINVNALFAGVKRRYYAYGIICIPGM